MCIYIYIYMYFSFSFKHLVAATSKQVAKNKLCVIALHVVIDTNCYTIIKLYKWRLELQG